MRVSTSQLYLSSTRSMIDRQAQLLRTQQQMSTGQRLLSPADDPLAAAQAQGYAQARDVTAQYSQNVASARASLAIGESALGDANGALQDIRERLIQAGNSSLTDADRRAIAADVQSRYDQLLSIANRQDGQGRYLFAGFREEAPPFVATPAGVTYVGDQGVRQIEVGASRSIAVTANGAAIFQGLPTGNGTFTASPAGANTGDAAISPGQVTSAPALTGHAYAIDFAVAGGVTTYTVRDTTAGTVLSAGNPYTSGAGIVFDGQQVAVTGTPAAGDSFTVAPSTAQDLFTTLRNAIAALNTPQSTAPAKGNFRTALDRSLTEIDAGAEKLLAARAQFGSGLRELDALDDAHAGARNQLEGEITRLTALDYAAAVSEFTAEQQALEAAQKAFQGMTSLSLFKII